MLYELAVRHAIEKPIIHAIEPKLSKIPFDIAGFRTIEFDLTDPDSIESAVEQLKKQAEQAQKGKWGETPVKLANIMRRTNEDSSETLLLKEAVQGISRLHSDVSDLASTVASHLARSESSIGAFYSPPNSPYILGNRPNVVYLDPNYGSQGVQSFQPAAQGSNTPASLFSGSQGVQSFQPAARGSNTPASLFSGSQGETPSVVGSAWTLKTGADTSATVEHISAKRASETNPEKDPKKS